MLALTDGYRMFGKRFATRTNSSKLITPSPSVSACVRIVSAFFCTSLASVAIWFAFRMSTSSSRVITPSPFTSKIANANFSLSSFAAPVKFERPIMNSRTSMEPLLSASKIWKRRSVVGEGSMRSTSQNSA